MTKFFRSILCYGVWLCSLALVSGHLSGYAQTLPSGLDITAGRSDISKILGAQKTVTPTGEMFFEGPVNPDEYVVGPGDRLSIVFWQPTYTDYPLVVNGEGDLIVPYVGVVRLGGSTLTQSRAKIEAAVAGSMRSARITVALLEPRRFRVHVTGLVENPGTYVVSATARIADAIDMAGGLKRLRTFSRGDTSSIVQGSQRRIELSDPNGASAGRADLLLFREAGLISANPRVRDGETIHVPYPDVSQRQIGAFGAVNQSGLFEFVPGDRVIDVLNLAGGMTAMADSASVAVVSETGTRAALSLKTASPEAGLDRTLNPGDRIYVGAFPDTNRAGSMIVSGEVARPGGFPVVSGVTSLREVLEQAGGVLPSAAVTSARLIRKVTVDPAEPERSRLIAASMLRNPLPQTSMAEPQLLSEFGRWDYGTVVLDLSDASNPKSDAGNLKLQDGDVLDIPKNPLGVRVIGFVNHAGEVAWEPGQSADHYLKLAGGVNAGGWHARIMILKARNNSQIRYQTSLPIDPGDVIIVPAIPDHTTWDRIKDFVAVTAEIVTVALVVQNITKK